MKSFRFFGPVTTFFLLLAAFAMVSGCGGGGGGGGGAAATPAGTGNVAILLTDAPSDEFAAINMRVTRAELLSDSGGHVTIFEGDRTFNLLDLSDAHIFAIRAGVPAGTYGKIRLTLSDLELVFKDSTIPSVHPKLPGNGKLDLNPRGEFRVVPGETLAVQLDVDANKSIHIVETGNEKYQFRPVVFVDIITDAFKERFVKLHGVIADIDDEDREFRLCKTNIALRDATDRPDDGSLRCVEVDATSDTSIFDISGKPVGFADLDNGEEATVFGRLVRDDDEDGDDDAGHDDSHELDDLTLVASLIELGPQNAFLKFAGHATTTVGADRSFQFDVDSGQAITVPASLKVVLQQGTRIIDRHGQALTDADITPGTALTVRGVLDVANDVVFASLVVIASDVNVQLSGTIGANPDTSCGLTVITAGGDRSVKVGAGTGIFLIADGSSKQIGVGELATGQSVDVYGSENTGTGCFDAETIIAFSSAVPL